MPRRVYTYPSSLGWTAYNLAETIGAFVLAGGLLLIVANLVWSRFRGEVVGRNPWNAPTLEWATTSPPQSYNFAQIPRVTSEYPLWNDDVRGSGLVLDEGHEQPTSTVRDGFFDAVVDMPSESAAPIVTALALSLAFAMLLTTHYVAALIFFAVTAACVGAWLWHEPAEEAPA
jgi:cytochrome c oxidase subunit 1/cytochrome c oxidase subunit I+III